VTGGCNAGRMSTQTPTRDDAVLLTPAEAARRANVCRATVYRAIDRGELRARHVGRLLRIDPDDSGPTFDRDGGNHG
jgi:excisionase family DNA binding protein